MEHNAIFDQLFTNSLVWGIFNDIYFPFVLFPTKDLPGDQLFSIIWDSIEWIECLRLKVVVLTLTTDSNRTFFRMYNFNNDQYFYCTKNICC